MNILHVTRTSFSRKLDNTNSNGGNGSSGSDLRFGIFAINNISWVSLQPYKNGVEFDVPDGDFIDCSDLQDDDVIEIKCVGSIGFFGVTSLNLGSIPVSTDYDNTFNVKEFNDGDVVCTYTKAELDSKLAFVINGADYSTVGCQPTFFNMSLSDVHYLSSSSSGAYTALHPGGSWEFSNIIRTNESHIPAKIKCVVAGNYTVYGISFDFEDYDGMVCDVIVDAVDFANDDVIILLSYDLAKAFTQLILVQNS